ncbi:hypothetical protein GCM10025877_28450 [Agromyces mangrovi Wang et al. 2018]|nr:hypothetical protein GCM10025877_28450 [Agromyces mangrovi]
MRERAVAFDGEGGDRGVVRDDLDAADGGVDPDDVGGGHAPRLVAAAHPDRRESDTPYPVHGEAVVEEGTVPGRGLRPP